MGKCAGKKPNEVGIRAADLVVTTDPGVDRARRQATPPSSPAACRPGGLLTRRTRRCLPADLLAKVTGLHHESGTGGSECAPFSRRPCAMSTFVSSPSGSSGLTLVGKIIDHVSSILYGADLEQDALVHTRTAAVGS